MTLQDDRDNEEIRRKRRAVCDALHGMHVDQMIRVDSTLAARLERAWDEYDSAIRDGN